MQRFKTIQQLEEYYYGRNAFGNVMKADDPYLTTTTGIYNPIYGQKVWSQLNQEKNVFACLPKKPWNSTGWRVISARSDTSTGATITTVSGGVAEGGAIPDTVKPTYAEVYTKPKTLAHGFSASEVDKFLSGVDDALDPMASAREYFAIEHPEHMNAMLLANPATAVAGNNLESLDRVIGSYQELTDFSNLGANEMDIFGLDRDAGATWTDAYVSYNASGSASSPRDLTLSLMDSTLTNIRQNGGQPDVIFTGWDTLERLQGLLQAQRRFGNGDEKLVIPTFNGIKGAPVSGYEGGFTVATYQGIPIIPTKECLQDTISRMYFVDSRYMHLKIAKPTQYFETGISSGNPFAINAFADEGLYRTMAELVCTFFKAHGKLRDLK